jgi:excisionase family DNA binding protein
VNERLLLKVDEVAEMLGLGRSKTYELVATGVLPAVRLGRSVRVPAKGLRQWLDEQWSEQPVASQRKGG